MVKIRPLLLYTALLVLLGGIYYLVAPPQMAVPHSSWRHGLGEAVGSGAFWLFGLIYGRTILKILLRQGPLLERLLPEGQWNSLALPLGRKLLRLLNRTHPYVGVAVVVLCGSHALLEGITGANHLLQVILVLALWQFGFGLFLLYRYQAVFLKRLKRYGYLAHSQLYTGVTLGVCALFGHLLVKG